MNGSSQGREGLVPQTVTSRPSGDSQLNLLGASDVPEDLDLGPVQREVMRHVREHETVSTDEAGALAHAHSGRHTAEMRCMWCAVRGTDVLRSLIARGRLIKRPGGAGLPTPERGLGDLPEGF